jgi:hypothetical protein
MKKKGHFSMKHNNVASANKNKQRAIGVASHSIGGIVGVKHH